MQSKKVQMKENNIYCSLGHGKDIISYKQDENNQYQLLCQECLRNNEHLSKPFRDKIFEVQDFYQQQFDIFQKKIQFQIMKINCNIQKLTDFQKSFHAQIVQINVYFRKQIDYLEDVLNYRSQYSFYQEFQNYLQKKNSLLNEDQIIQHQFSHVMQKINIIQKKMESEKENLKKVFEINNLSQNDDWNTVFNKLSIKKINQNQNIGCCYAISTNYCDDMIISCAVENILLHSFKNGNMKLQHELKIHQEVVKCLISSKKQNYFISGDQKGVMIFWQQQFKDDYKYWTHQKYQAHTDQIDSLIMNKNESQLFSGGKDRKIIIWNIKFNPNYLEKSQCLEQHENRIRGLSLNNYENILISCSNSPNRGEIIVWELGEKGQFQFKCFVKANQKNKGNKICFIKNDLFLWISDEQEEQPLYFFELIDEKFTLLNRSNTIQLEIDNKLKDQSHFPIIHHKEMNLIVIRYQNKIHFIRRQQDNTFTQEGSISCLEKNVKGENVNSVYTFGTITNDAKYLIYFQGQFQGNYFIHELSYTH